MSDSIANVTVEELFRAVNLIRGDIYKLTSKIDEKPSKRDIEYLERRVKDLEEWRIWAMRIGVPGLAAGVLSLIDVVSRSV